MSSLDGRQRVREVVTLALQEDYRGATDIIGEISQEPEASRGAMIYLIHLVLALGTLSIEDQRDFQKVLQHVFAVSAGDEIEAMGL